VDKLYFDSISIAARVGSVSEEVAERRPLGQVRENPKEQKPEAGDKK
jgi:hypothetical protein